MFDMWSHWVANNINLLLYLANFLYFVNASNDLIFELGIVDRGFLTIKENTFAHIKLDASFGDNELAYRDWYEKVF